MTLDVKDKKILYQLCLDGRQSYNAIGKQVGLTKNVVGYRIERMKENGIITGFQTLINYFNLGYSAIRLYFSFQYVHPDIKREIITHFVHYKYATIVTSIKGSYDMLVYFITKNIHDLYPFWQQTHTKFGNYFSEQKMSIYLGEYYYPPTFLLEKHTGHKRFITREPGEKIPYDSLDIAILKHLSQNPRMPTVDIARSQKVSALTVKKHIQHLIDTGIILGFRVMFNPKQLGYTFYKVDIYLREYANLPTIITYIEQNPHLVSIDKTMGYADLELELYLENTDQVHRYMEDLTKAFPDMIKNYTYFQDIHDHKRLNLPPLKSAPAKKP